jgi:hypothetical protein
MKRLKIFLLLLALPLLFITSCKKDEPTPEGVTYKSPSAAGRNTVVDIPAGLTAKANGGDINASIAVTYMSLANAISGFAASFTLPSNAQLEGKKSNSKVYHWSIQGYSYWMTYTELADKYTWRYEYEFPGVPRFTYISAEELKTGKQGSWIIYNPEATTSAIWTYNWSINASNAFIANMTWNDGQEPSTFDVTSNADHSGNFIYKAANIKQAEIIWASNGSGTYWLIGDGTAAIEGSWQ